MITLVLALLVMGLVVIGLSIGRILTGKQHLHKHCGRRPKRLDERKSTPDDQSTCPLCHRKDSCRKEEEDEHDT